MLRKANQIFKQKRLIIMLSNLRIRLGETKEFNSQSRPKDNRNHNSNGKGIEMARQHIDRSLKKAYQQLRGDAPTTQKPLQMPSPNAPHPHQSRTALHQRPPSSTAKLICLRRRNIQSANGQYLTQSFKQNNHSLAEGAITLVDNRDIMQYIQLIYETYNIPDPLVDSLRPTTAEATIEKNRKGTSRDEEEHSLNSARTTKEDAQNIAEITEFDVGFENKVNETALKKNKRILITLRSNSAQKNELKSIKRTAEKPNPLLPLKQNKYNSLTQTSAVSPPSQRIQDETREPAMPVFRYCFACERPILEQNIRKHESECAGLQQAYGLSFHQIMAIVDEKIEKIVGLIQAQILNVTTDCFGRKLQHLQGLIKRWVSKVPQAKQPTEGHRIGGSMAGQFGVEFEQIRQDLGSNFYDKFELLNKLNWFTKLRCGLIKQQSYL